MSIAGIINERILFMKQYRIMYEALFLPRPIEGFEYKGKHIEALVLYFLYRYFDSKTGKEIFFNQAEQPVREFNCSIDKENLYQMTPLHRTDCKVTYKLYECYVHSRLEQKPEMISCEDALDILKENYQLWDNSNNKPTQCTSYGMVKV